MSTMFSRLTMKRYVGSFAESHPILGVRNNTYALYADNEKDAREWMQIHQRVNGIECIRELSFREVTK